MMSRPVLGILLLLASATPSFAEDAGSKAAPSKERETLEAYGRQNLKCEEWSDGCAVCSRQEDAKIACSLPGIACQPEAPSCRRVKAAAETEKPAK